MIRLLAEIWTASGYLCGQRLKAALPHWLPWLKRRATIMPTVERQLVRISARQMDRRLAARTRRIKRRLYGTTRPGSLLKHLNDVGGTAGGHGQESPRGGAGHDDP